MGRNGKTFDFFLNTRYNERMKLIPFQETDYLSLRAFMQPLWLETYGGFLPKKQIELLLDKYFSTSGIARYRSEGYEYFKVDDVGVLVICERATDVYLDKLYLLPSARGKGYASFVFDELLKRGKDITLNVNQNNARAVACYQKNGFTVEKQVENPLGGGMFNHDYVMRKKAK